jgi:hypothetical protein
MQVVEDRYLEVLAALCIGRRDDYALQQSNGRYVRAGTALTLETVRAHVMGWHTIGTYVIDERGGCRFAVFDADSVDGLMQLVRLQARLLEAGISSVLEGSRRGGHLWVLLAAPLSAGLLRRWLQPYCPAGVEFYPKQDAADQEHPGALIRVPLGVHRLTGRRYPFLVPDGERVQVAARSLAGSLEWLASVKRVPVPEREAVEERETVRRVATHTYVAEGVGGAPLARVRSLSPVPASIHAWCDAQDAVAVIGRYVSLDARGMGCCPFGWHHSDGKDSHPSLWVHPPRGSGGPCWYCHVWGRSGNLFDFVCLWYGLSPAQMWRRIRAGEIF